MQIHSRSSRAAAFASVLAGSALLAGCHQTEWRFDKPIAKSRDRIWEAADRALLELDYPGYEENDKDAGHLLTKWRFKDAVHAHDGKRHQVELEIEEAEPPVDPKTGDKQWVVKIKAVEERNEDLVNPRSYAQAEWRWLGQDAEEEELILGKIWFYSMDPEELTLSDEAARLAEMSERHSHDGEIQKTNEEIREKEEALARLRQEGEAMSPGRGASGEIPVGPAPGSSPPLSSEGSLAAGPVAGELADVTLLVAEVLEMGCEYPGFESKRPEEGTLLTYWRFRPSVQELEGNRERIAVALQKASPPFDGATGRPQWIVSIASQKEINENTTEPHKYEAARWRPIGRDEAEERRILSMVSERARQDGRMALAETPNSGAETKE